MIVNFKTYPEATGRRALELAKTLDNIQKETGVPTIIAAQATDILRLSQHIEVPLFAQHIDLQPQGGHTGHICPEAVRESGGRGTLLNHSERQLGLATIEGSIERARAVGLTSVVCSNNVAVGAACAALRPDMVAIEPPELIGTGIAVSKARPEIVTATVARIRDVNRDITILCGAGISEACDASSALKLGAQGILISSGVVKAKDQRGVALDITREMLHFAEHQH